MTDTRLPRSLALVGAGKMGGAMLEGWLAAGLPGAAVSIHDPQPSEAMARLCAEKGVAVNPQPGAAGSAEVLVLAIKPQMLDAAAPALQPLVSGETLVVSVLAGKTVANLEAALPAARAIVRAMPNLPASIGAGATGAYANAGTSAEQREIADTLLRASGLVEWVEDEALIDAVTGVSGSGPAYVFALVEALAQAGVAAGLAEDLAMRLARQTVVGAGALLAQSDLPAATLRANVTSPGGTTAAGLAVLQRAENGLPDLVRETVAAAKRRAGELSG
ncbi:pyrroline-5-carboxylate reductase [Salinarimonas ramus]|uniref:Pyrroline-5-carboxylate reductase n=1 Tax=Salinarimonas ramus TaxID=690164 RepID=A0A917V6V6_9HYPH|nr:pyrroline-5-carboxylate reductase [Salinarimonas ramus]GGK44623.1 pyrroline-5-carboxylate reductase [Salinarimonas ramus]